MAAKLAVLFVCLGNICRSPLAEAAFRREAKRAGLDAEADSAGTGNWHVGEPPDERAQAVARRHGVDIAGYRARQVGAEDFHRFTHIIALDLENLRALNAIKPRDGTASLSLLLDYAPGHKGEAVADPYYGGSDGFDMTWEDVMIGSQGLVRHLAEGR
jgi:protein-tyrosine phosphatase